MTPAVSCVSTSRADAAESVLTFAGPVRACGRGPSRRSCGCGCDCGCEVDFELGREVRVARRGSGRGVNGGWEPSGEWPRGAGERGKREEGRRGRGRGGAREAAALMASALRAWRGGVGGRGEARGVVSGEEAASQSAKLCERGCGRRGFGLGFGGVIRVEAEGGGAEAWEGGLAELLATGSAVGG